MVIRRPAGAAAMRLDAAEVLTDLSVARDPGRHLTPPKVVPFAVAAAAVIGLTGTGVMPLPVAVALDLGALLCYLLALRAALPHPPRSRGATFWWSRGLEPAVLALTSVLAGALLLVTVPGLPWSVIAPIWLLLMLAVAPWLDGAAECGGLSSWGATVLSSLVVTVPVAFFVVGMAPGVPSPALVLVVGVGALVPCWRMVRLAGWHGALAWERAAMVAVLMAAAAVLASRLQVPGPLLPVAMLVGWYGLTGVASLRDRRQLGSFATFVVLAAAILAIAAPA